MKKFLWVVVLTISMLLVVGCVPLSSEEDTNGGEPDNEITPSVSPISQVKEVDENGEPTQLGEIFTVEGIALVDSGVLDGNRTVYIQDETGGIALYDGSGSLPEISEGDELRVTGELGFYRGLTQLSPTDTEPFVTILSSGNPLPEPEEIDLSDLADFEIAEQLEGTLVTVEATVESIPSSAQGGGYNVKIKDGEGTTITLRVMEGTGINVQEALSVGATYRFVGIVGQYDSSSPYTEGYQIFPRKPEDIELIEDGGEPDNGITPSVSPISQIKEVDENGEPIQLGEIFTVEGIALVDSGVLDGNRTVYIQDETGGIALYDGSGSLPEISEGDKLRVTGELAFFRGLTELSPTGTETFVTILSSDNPLPEPEEINLSDLANFETAEPLEGTLVTVEATVESIPSSASGGGYNVKIKDGEGTTITLRVMEGTGINVQEALSVGATYRFVGIVGQYDSSSPYTEGYQIFPRKLEDIELFEE